jgi:pSer/pThr/pTyr-binding forkhead associated (FHA) protein
MILCPNCHHQELPGALFCSECGAQLVSVDALTTQNLNQVHSDILNPNIFNTISETEQEIPESVSGDFDSVVSLHLVEAARTIHLSGRPEYSVGRVAEGQPILPDIDLSEFEAYAQGVSRLHASIKIGLQRVSIMDLGSSNGTRVNGQKIVPHVDYPLKHGDIIALGKLKVQLVIHKRS